MYCWQSESDLSDTGTDSDSSELKKQVSYLKSLFTKNNEDIDGQLSEIEDLFNSSLFETGDLMACHDRVRLEESEFESLCKEENGRLSLAFEMLPAIPRKAAEKFGPRIHTLDLSNNCIKDLSFLSSFKTLHTLILDNNTALNEVTLPYLPSLRILWLNKCDINNLPKWIQRLKTCTPQVRQLSLLGNPGALSIFNGASSVEHNDYIMYVVGVLDRLEVLDDHKITDEQRCNAKTHIGAYTMSGGPLKFMERFAGASNLLTFFKYDYRKTRPMISNATTPNNKGQPAQSKLPSATKNHTKN